MAKVRRRRETGLLFLDFHFRGKRCREQTALTDTAANRKRLEVVAKKIAASITLGTFEYRDFFPNSSRATQFDKEYAHQGSCNSTLNRPESTASAPTFGVFVERWWEHHHLTLRYRTQVSYRGVIDKYLVPHLGKMLVDEIGKHDVLDLRSALAKVPGRSGNDTLSAKTINYILGVLRAVLSEAADEYQFSHPMQNLRRLKQRKPEIKPFSLNEVKVILATVRKDFRDYFTVRFFTGMRTGEIHGLRWTNVDFERGCIHVRETWARHGREQTKTAESARDIEMSSVVCSALLSQQRRTGNLEYVFSNAAGNPLDEHNVTRRVWYPLLRHLNLDMRRPYQCRHTAATLWLAAGENPQWIAMQLGHTTPEMLFRVYARFVPNLTRLDGSAMDRLLLNHLELTHV